METMSIEEFKRNIIDKRKNIYEDIHFEEDEELVLVHANGCFVDSDYDNEYRIYIKPKPSKKNTEPPHIQVIKNHNDEWCYLLHPGLKSGLKMLEKNPHLLTFADKLVGLSSLPQIDANKQNTFWKRGIDKTPKITKEVAHTTQTPKI